MAMMFEIKDIETHPLDTGVEQYIQIEVEITQYYPDPMYAKETDTEIYSGEGVGLL